MRKLLLIFMALCVVFFMVAIASVGSDKAGDTVNGWVTDSNCGVKGAAAGKEECAKKCLEKGAKMVVVTDKDQKVLTVDNPDALKEHIGHHVAITGQATADSIHVESVKML
jgi:hypothetical protein